MRRGAENFTNLSVGEEVAYLLALSDDEKRSFCLELLDEFGAQNVSVRGDEILHSCCLPFGFHRNGDQNPSANLNWAKLTYKCHGCGEGGGIAWFITACRGGDGEETKKWLANQTSTTSTESLQRLLAYMDSQYQPDVETSKVPMPKYDTSILDQWQTTHPYLTQDRHIPQSNLELLHIRYDDQSNRIVLPHFWHGELVGWQTRQLVDDGGPKYKNTPGFPKNETLYNIPARISPVTVVESVLSVASKVHLCPTMVATFGASVTDTQKHLLAGYPQVTLWFDNDPAGVKATLEVGEFLVKYTSVFVVNSDWAADPGDMDDETFLAAISNVVPFTLWNPPSQLKEYTYGTP